MLLRNLLLPWTLSKLDEGAETLKLMWQSQLIICFFTLEKNSGYWERKVSLKLYILYSFSAFFCPYSRIATKEITTESRAERVERAEVVAVIDLYDRKERNPFHALDFWTKTKSIFESLYQCIHLNVNKMFHNSNSFVFIFWLISFRTNIGKFVRYSWD